MARSPVLLQSHAERKYFPRDTQMSLMGICFASLHSFSAHSTPQSPSSAEPHFGNFFLFFKTFMHHSIFLFMCPNQAQWWDLLLSRRGEEPRWADLYSLLIILLAKEFCGVIAWISSWHGCWGPLIPLLCPESPCAHYMVIRRSGCTYTLRPWGGSFSSYP